MLNTNTHSNMHSISQVSAESLNDLSKLIVSSITAKKETELKRYKSKSKGYPKWMTKEAIATLESLVGKETAYEVWERVVNSAASYLYLGGFDADFCSKFAEDLFEVLANGWLGLATPVLTKLGKPRGDGLPISCFSISVEDSISGIFDSLAESAIMTKNGGGVGVYMGNIRPINTDISTGGKTSGSVPFSKLFDSTAKTVAQGSARRGSFAIYLPIEHPDIKAFLKSKDHTEGDSRRWIDSNIAVTISNAWMKSMLSGDEEKRDLFIELLLTRLKCGSPYILYIDHVNNANPEAYKKNNLKVETSNLCLSGETRVATTMGAISLKEMYETRIIPPVYTENIEQPTFGPRTQEAKIVFQGIKKVIKLTLSDGSSFKCTPDHRIALKNKEWIEAQYSLNKKIRTIGQLQDIFVQSIEPIAEAEEVYDLHVEVDKNFYIITDLENYSGLLVHNCSEIMLHTDKDHSFVCCLSSLNLDKYDEWVNHKTKNLKLSVPFISTIFLDAVLSEFIDKASDYKEMERAIRSAVKGRALGLGSMGLASLYQKRNLAWYEQECYDLNIQVHKYIYEETKEASKFLAKHLGEPEWCVGTGMRNSHTVAVAPTRTNSAVTCAVSMGIEPIDANYFAAKQNGGVFVRKNPNLEKLLKEKYKKNTVEVWEQISKDRGSVKNLEFMDKHDKRVFRTAREIDQQDLIWQAGDRQPYIDQGQSLNLFVDPYCSEQYLVGLHVLAWKLGLKSLYYLRSRSKQSLSTLNLLITKKGCDWCTKLKEELNLRNIAYTEVTLSEAKRKGLWQQSYKTTPQLFFDGERIGGYSDFMSKYVYGVESSSTPLHVDGETNGTRLSQTDEYLMANECTACEG